MDFDVRVSPSPEPLTVSTCIANIRPFSERLDARLLGGSRLSAASNRGRSFVCGHDASSRNIPRIFDGLSCCSRVLVEHEVGFLIVLRNGCRVFAVASGQWLPLGQLHMQLRGRHGPSRHSALGQVCACKHEWRDLCNPERAEADREGRVVDTDRF